MAEEKQSMKHEVLKNITALLTAAFGLIAALAWNNAISALFSKVFGTPNALVPQVSYAILVTIIAVVVTVYVSRVGSKLGVK